MTTGSTAQGRQKIACTDPTKCGGARWHYADSSPLCRASAGGGSSASPLLSSMPSSTVRHEDETSLMTMPSDRWDEIVHAAGTELGPTDTVLDREDFNFTHDDVGYDRGDGEYMTREKFYREADEGRRVFDNVEFADPMGEGETRGMVFTGCRFHQDVGLGDRSVLSGCTFDRNLEDASMVEGGGRVSAIVEGAKVHGDVRVSGTSHVALSDVIVSGDVHAKGGNGLQAVFLSDVQADGIIYMDDSEAIVMNNHEYGNVIALHGSQEGMLAPGNSGGATYHGFSPDDIDDSFESSDPEETRPAVHIVSYDDLQEAQQVPGQTELDGSSGYEFDRFAEMDARVDVLARERHKGVRGRNY